MSFQISGASSGIPTDQIIQQMMAIERRPQVLMERQIQMLQWKKGIWNDINSRLLDLKNSIENLLNRDKLLINKVSSSDDKIITASASGMAASGEYEVFVHNLATSTKLISGVGAGLGLGAKIDPAAVLKDAKFGIPITKGIFTINGVQIEIEEGDFLGTGAADDLDPHSILNKINSSGAKVKATYDPNTDRISIQATEPGGTVNLGAITDTSNFLSATYLVTAPGETVDGLASRTSTNHLGHVNPRFYLIDANFATPLEAGESGEGIFKINGVEIKYNIKEDTLNKVINRINYSDAGVSAYYDPLTDRIILQNKKTGTFAITVEDVEGNMVSALNLDQNTTTQMGENAMVTVSGYNNGEPIYSTTNQVTNVIPGLTINLNAKTTESVKVKVEQDTDAIKNVIKDFVNKYNETVKFLNSRLKEKTVTDKEWEEMSESEMRMGILRGNSALSRIRYGLLDQAIDPLSGDSGIYNVLSAIGIESVIDTSEGGVNSGTLKIDEKKLEEAIRNNPDGVANLFFNDLDGNGKINRDSENKPTEVGIAVRLVDYLDDLLDTKTYGAGIKGGVIPRQQDELEANIKYIQKRVDDFEVRMEQREESLLRQFTAMEKALAAMQNQSNWLAGQLAGLYANNSR